jgi:hypothetical protein
MDQLQTLKAATANANAGVTVDFCSLWKSTILPILTEAQQIAPEPLKAIIGAAIGLGNLLCPVN